MNSITTPDPWQAFADATLSHDHATAAPLGCELAAQTPPVALARKARHRKPNRRPVASLFAGALLLAATGLAGAALAAMQPAAAPPVAAPVVRVELTSVNWHAVTCRAFLTWERYQTTPNLDAAMAASFHVTWKWLGDDVDSLYRDARSGRPRYVADDAQQVSADCGL